MASGMQLTVSHEQGRVPITVFHLKGEIDAVSYEQLEREATTAFEAGMRNLLLDLSKVTYISSAGLRALHNIFNMLRTSSPAESDESMKRGLRDGTFKSPHLKLLNPSTAVLETLRTAGFDMFLDIHHKLREAVTSF